MYKPCFPFNNGTSDILCSIYSENRKQLQNNSKQSQTNLPLIGHRTRFLKPIGKEFKINGKLIVINLENRLTKFLLSKKMLSKNCVNMVT